MTVAVTPLWESGDDRDTGWAANGFVAVCKEYGQPVTPVSAHEVDGQDVVLIPLLSSEDVERMVLTWKRRPDCGIVVAGGQGAYAVEAMRDLVDVVHFGRAEDRVKEIVAGTPHESTWVRAVDPALHRRYKVRAATHLLDTEMSVGCQHKCMFCQYSWTHPLFGSEFNSGLTSRTPEYSWNELPVTKPGLYKTALDGLSEATRRRVNKASGLTNADVTRRLREWGALRLDKHTIVQVNHVIGYPWETRDSIYADLVEFLHAVQAADMPGGSNIDIKLRVFIYAPSALTPMQFVRLSLVDWRTTFLAAFEKICSRHVFRTGHFRGPRYAEGDPRGRNVRTLVQFSNLRVFSPQQLCGPFKHIKQVAIERGCSREAFVAGVRAAKQGKLAMEQAELFVREAGDFLGNPFQGRHPSTYLEGPVKIPSALVTRDWQTLTDRKQLSVLQQ